MPHNSTPHATARRHMPAHTTAPHPVAAAHTQPGSGAPSSTCSTWRCCNCCCCCCCMHASPCPHTWVPCRCAQPPACRCWRWCGCLHAPTACQLQQRTGSTAWARGPARNTNNVNQENTVSHLQYKRCQEQHAALSSTGEKQSDTQPTAVPPTSTSIVSSTCTAGSSRTSHTA